MPGPCPISPVGMSGVRSRHMSAGAPGHSARQFDKIGPCGRTVRHVYLDGDDALARRDVDEADSGDDYIFDAKAFTLDFSGGVIDPELLVQGRAVGCRAAYRDLCARSADGNDQAHPVLRRPLLCRSSPRGRIPGSAFRSP